ncbi:hypothetical protein DP23_4114 [Ralstonia pickettii]|nr:hypothetical protein DP23_4114 [Ralstonia pickettii]
MQQHPPSKSLTPQGAENSTHHQPPSIPPTGGVLI